jgi:hypothetical protein
MNDNDREFAKDMLRGAEEIADFLYGDREQRRQGLSSRCNVTLARF